MPEAPDDRRALDDRIGTVIEDAGLRRPRNAFFRLARAATEVDGRAALGVAIQWRAVTKAFMFTTLASLGLKAREFHAQADPDRRVLGAFRTVYAVIGDDLANFAPQFSSVAPSGADGVHYVWWADSIVAPLADALGPGEFDAVSELPDGVRALIDNMERLALGTLGAAVQLRVVEDIAQDIAVAFRRMFAKVCVGGEPVFAASGSLDWMDSHIKAETAHAASVSDDEAGMTALVTTQHERDTLLALVTEYAASWSLALDDFAAALSADRSPVATG